MGARTGGGRGVRLKCGCDSDQSGSDNEVVTGWKQTSLDGNRPHCYFHPGSGLIVRALESIFDLIVRAFECDWMKMAMRSVSKGSDNEVGAFESEAERWGAGVETQKNVREEIGGWGREPFHENYALSLSTIYDGA